MNIIPLKEHARPCDFVKTTPMFKYEIACFCGKSWEWTTRKAMGTREVAEMASAECWTIDDDGHPRCTTCLRDLRAGMRVDPPSNLGSTQEAVLESLVQHGSWRSQGICTWVWDTKSGTKKVLDTLVKRGLVVVDKKGVYTATLKKD